MSDAGQLETRTLSVEGRPATVHVGGKGGEPLVLVHGAWAGAALHWDAVWGRLAERFRVVAPELPGIGTPEPALASVEAYARWLAGVLDALGLSGAWCVGNSAGAAVVSAFAALFPGRCRGAVLVDGAPLGRTPGLVRALVAPRAPTRPLARALYHRLVFGPAARARAFAHPERLPPALAQVFEQRAPPQLDAMLDLARRGGPGAPPGFRPLLLWGAADRLPGCTVKAARKLAASLPGAQLALVPDAGHLPQRENPDAFLAALLPFLEGGAAAGAR